MRLKGLIDEDTVNYCKTAMYIIFPTCSFKCDKENGISLCQNSALATYPDINITKEELCERYLNNPITHAVVCGGLEPFDSELDLLSFIDTLRRKYQCQDDIVIYTGYTEEEIFSGKREHATASSVELSMIQNLLAYDNIIIKFGRFKPNQQSHYDAVLGVNLASDNQYAKAFRRETIDD